MAADDVFSLRNVDYSETGMELEIIVEGQSRPQTVIYSTVDYQGEKWYYSGRWKGENGRGKVERRRGSPLHSPFSIFHSPSGVMDMVHDLKVVYDERDTLEAWIPKFDVGPEHDRESGPYEMFSNARLKGADSALDWLIVNSFSYAYPVIMAEVRSKEASIPDRYNVPEFGLYDVPLSTVLEYVYQTYVQKRPSPVLEATVVVVQRAIPLPDHVIHKTNIRDNTRLLVQVIDENTLQFSKADGDSR